MSDAIQEQICEPRKAGGPYKVISIFLLTKSMLLLYLFRSLALVTMFEFNSAWVPKWLGTGWRPGGWRVQPSVVLLTVTL